MDKSAPSGFWMMDLIPSALPLPRFEDHQIYPTTTPLQDIQSRRKTMASFAPSLTLAISLHDAHMRHGRLLAISAVEQCDSKRLELVMALKAE